VKVDGATLAIAKEVTYTLVVVTTHVGLVAVVVETAHVELEG